MYEQIKLKIFNIGHQAERLRKANFLYSEKGNGLGYFLRFENYTDDTGHKVEESVIVTTNCFRNESDLKSYLLESLLLKD